MSNGWISAAIQSVTRIGMVPGSVEYINALQECVNRGFVKSIPTRAFVVTEKGGEWLYNYQQTTEYKESLS
jgi:predicted transcriptional regulator